MSFENPFAKLNTARQDSDKQKLEASRQPGVLNPRGQGGPVFDQMKEAMDTIGTEEDQIDRGNDAEQIGRVRELFEQKMRRTGKRIYDQYLVGVKGSPSFDSYENNVEKSFQHGFDLYLKTMMRLDEKKAPDPHEPYFAQVQGKGRMRVVDQLDKNYYVQQYIAQGKDLPERVTGSQDGLDRSYDDHNFDPKDAMDGYAEKYQSTVRVDGDEISNKNEAAVQAGLESYMFEKLRLYSSEYFEMLEESLKRGLKPKDAYDMAMYVYGNNAGIYEEMDEHDLDANFVANQSILNRARVRVPFEKYVEAGERLNDRYPYEPGTKGMVTSPKMVRNLLFKYPQTVESGLGVANVELGRLQETYPTMPKYLLTEMCVGAPDKYEERIREFLGQAHDLMKEYPLGDYFDDESGVDIFSHYKVEGVLLRMLDRVSSKNPKEHIDRALGTFQETLKRAEEKGVDTSYSAQRRMLQSLLGYNASAEKVLKREERITNRRVANYDKLLEKAEAKDPYFGGYQVDLGYGDSEDEILETGKIQTDLIIDQFGESDSERHLDRLTDVLYEYVEQFPPEQEYINALKDSLVMDPYDPRDAFEKLYPDLQWPEEVETIEF